MGGEDSCYHAVEIQPQPTHIEGPTSRIQKRDTFVSHVDCLTLPSNTADERCGRRSMNHEAQRSCGSSCDLLLPNGSGHVSSIRKFGRFGGTYAPNIAFAKKCVI